MNSKILLLTSLMIISLFSFGQQKQALPLNENFDASTDLPVGWTLQTTGTYGWMTRPWAYSEPNALSIPYETEEKNDWVFTPGIELTEAKTYIIEFMLKTEGWDSNSLDLRIGTAATSAGMTDLIWQRTDMATGKYEQVITKYTATSTATFYFGWFAYSPVNQDYIAIDDVSIYEAPDVDVEILSSNLPEADVLGNSPNSSINVVNLGSSVASFDVDITINDGSSDVHTETVTVADLGIAESREVSFAEFIPTTEGSYTYTYNVNVTGTDATPTNNQLIKNVEIIAGCQHTITLSAPYFEAGWFGGHISVTTDGTPVLTNVSLYNGASIDYVFPSKTDADIVISFDGEGDLTDDCYWAVYNGENTLLIEGNGTGDDTPVTQNTTGFCSSTSKIININNYFIKISPNPSTGTINIDCDDNYNLSIIDITGKEVKNLNVYRNTKITILEKGLFFLKFQNHNNSVVKKLIVH